MLLNYSYSKLLLNRPSNSNTFLPKISALQICVFFIYSKPSHEIDLFKQKNMIFLLFNETSNAYFKHKVLHNFDMCNFLNLLLHVKKIASWETKNILFSLFKLIFITCKLTKKNKIWLCILLQTKTLSSQQRILNN